MEMNKFDTTMGIVKLIKNQLLSSGVDNQKQCVQYVKKILDEAGASENIVICMLIREDVTDFLCQSLCTRCDVVLRDICECLMMFARYKWFYEMRGRCKSLVACDVIQCIVRTLSLQIKQTTACGTILQPLQLLHYLLDRIVKRSIKLKDICDTRQLLSIGITLLNTKDRCFEWGIKLLLHLLCECHVMRCSYVKYTLKSLIRIHKKHMNHITRTVQLTHFSLICLDVITTNHALSSQLVELLFKNVIFLILPAYQDGTDLVKYKILQCILMFYRLKYESRQLSMSLVFNGFLVVLPQLSIVEKRKQTDLANLARDILTELILELSISHLPVDNAHEFKKQLHQTLTNMKSNTYEHCIIQLLDTIKQGQNLDNLTIPLVLLYFHLLFVSHFKDTDCWNTCLTSLLHLIRNNMGNGNAVPSLIVIKTIWFNLAVCMCKVDDKKSSSDVTHVNVFIDHISDNSQSLNVLITNHPVLLYFTFHQYVRSVKFQVDFIIQWLQIISDENEESFQRLLKLSLTNESFRFAILTIVTGYKYLAGLSVKVLESTSHLLWIIIKEKCSSSFIIARTISSAISDNLLLLSKFPQDNKLAECNLIWLLKSLGLQYDAYNHNHNNNSIYMENVIMTMEWVAKVICHLSIEDNKCLLLLLLLLLLNITTTQADVMKVVIMNKNFCNKFEWLINNSDDEEIRCVCLQLCNNIVILHHIHDKQLNNCNWHKSYSININWTTMAHIIYGRNMLLINSLMQVINTMEYQYQYECEYCYLKVQSIPSHVIASLVACLFNIYSLTANDTILSCLKSVVSGKSTLTNNNLISKHVANLPWLDDLPDMAK